MTYTGWTEIRTVVPVNHYLSRLVLVDRQAWPVLAVSANSADTFQLPLPANDPATY